VVYSLFTEGRAISMVIAGTWISVYWGSLTAGRLLSGLVVNFVPVSLLLRICIMGMACGAALIWINLTDLVSFLGLVLIGLFCAPVFPSMIATTPARLGKAHTANAVGFQMAAAVLGQSLLPAGIGVFARRNGLEIVAPLLFVAAMLLLALYEMLRAASTRSMQTEAHAVG
jgi:fucose permease